MPSTIPGVSVVLGGTSGIGAAVARELAATGDALILGYLQNRQRAEALAAELRDQVETVLLVEGNIAQADTLKALVAAVSELGGSCHRLVHSVAVTSFKPLMKVKPNQWDLIVGVSARSFVDAVRALSEALTRGTSIVTISSAGSTRFVPDYGALGPAKAALEGTVRQLAAELGPRGIRVNAVRAGLVQSPHSPVQEMPWSQEVERRTPLGRVAEARDIAPVVSFLLGPGAAWITGQIVEVDGGVSLT